MLSFLVVHITIDGVLHSVKSGVLVGRIEQFLHIYNNTNVDFNLK